MKKRTFLLFGLLAMLVLTACGGKSGAQTSTDDATDTSDNSQQTTAEETAQPIGQHHAQITIKDHGTIDIELDGDAAPISVQNFMDLANDGFYDGLTFHRIITGFMMQGGDPLGNGTGGPGYDFDDEIVPDLKFDHPYLLAMANAGLRRGMDGKIHGTNGSQFFITTVPTPWLDGHHTIFGEVADDDSKAVVDKLEAVNTDRMDRPTEPVGIVSVEVLK